MTVQQIYFANGLNGIFACELGVWYANKKIDDVSELDFKEMTNDENFVEITDKCFFDDFKQGTFIGTDIDPITKSVDLFTIAYEDILRDCEPIEMVN